MLKFPIPLPNSTLTLLVPKFATARSDFISPLKLPTVTPTRVLTNSEVNRKAKTSRSIAEQHAYEVLVKICDCEVRFGVTVEIAHGY